MAADQESLTESDLMYARNTDGSGKNNIPLTFIHKLSKVVVPYSRENVGVLPELPLSMMHIQAVS